MVSLTQFVGTDDSFQNVTDLHGFSGSRVVAGHREGGISEGAERGERRGRAEAAMASSSSPAAAARPPAGASTSSTPTEGSSAWSLVAWLPSTTRGISDVVSGSTALQEKRMP